MSTEHQILQEILKEAVLLQIGNRAVAIIKNRKPLVVEGEQQYSTTPFAMPVGAVKRSDVRMKIINGVYDDADVTLFRSKTDSLWAVIKHGYDWLRKESGRTGGDINMTWSGKLMRSLTVTKVDAEKGEIVIDHKDERSRQIALWQNVMGVGKKKTIHKYLVLTDDELENLGNLV